MVRREEGDGGRLGREVVELDPAEAGGGVRVHGGDRGRRRRRRRELDGQLSDDDPNEATRIHRAVANFLFRVPSSSPVLLRLWLS